MRPMRRKISNAYFSHTACFTNSSRRRLSKMAAPMTSNVSLNKKTLKYVVFGHIFSSLTLFGLVYISLNGFSQLDIISHPLSAMKLLMASSLIIHGCLHFCFGTSSWQKFKLGLWIKDALKCLLIFSLSVIFFHCIAVLFGAPFSQQTAETFHFAMMLSSTTIGPLLIHLWTDFDAWFRIVIYQSPELGIETIVYISSITSLLGAWLGAFPIPLDWDRPWQTWPITCVVGALAGHCLGIFVSAIYTGIQFNRGNKYKLT